MVNEKNLLKEILTQREGNSLSAERLRVILHAGTHSLPPLATTDMQRKVKHTYTHIQRHTAQHAQQMSRSLKSTAIYLSPLSIVLSSHP